MSSDASTLPLQGTLGRRAPALETRLEAPERAEQDARARTRTRWGLLALLLIAALSVVIVVVVADRPSGLAPTTHAGYFPHWMAGPLGGLLPGLTRSSTALREMFSAALVIMYGGYLIALANVRWLRARWVIATILAVHVVFLLAPPLALTDVFNYINYGRMEVVHHLNPYTTTPVFEPRNDPSYALSNWHELLSPYGPLFTLLTFALVPLGVAASFWVIKGILAVASLAIIALVWKCARLLGRDPVTAILLTGLNPIVLVWGLGGDHNDFLMVLPIVLGFYLLLLSRARASGEDAHAAARAASAGANGASPEQRAASERAAGGRWRGGALAPVACEVGAGVAFVTAVAIKASAAVLVPVVLAALLRTPRRAGRVLLGMAIATVGLGAASLYAFGPHIPDISTQSKLVTSMSLPNLFGLVIGSGGEGVTLHVILTAGLVLAVLACCVQAWRRHESLTACGWASIALVVTLSWVLPWYVLWVLPLAALSRSRRLRVTTLALGVYLIVTWMPASGAFWSKIHFRPQKTPLGELHQRYVKELLN